MILVLWTVYLHAAIGIIIVAHVLHISSYLPGSHGRCNVLMGEMLTVSSNHTAILVDHKPGTVIFVVPSQSFEGGNAGILVNYFLESGFLQTLAEGCELTAAQGLIHSGTSLLKSHLVIETFTLPLGIQFHAGGTTLLCDLHGCTQQCPTMGSIAADPFYFRNVIVHHNMYGAHKIYKAHILIIYVIEKYTICHQVGIFDSSEIVFHDILHSNNSPVIFFQLLLDNRMILKRHALIVYLFGSIIQYSQGFLQLIVIQCNKLSAGHWCFID